MKMKKNVKLFSLVLSMLMLFVLAAPGFAAAEVNDAGVISVVVSSVDAQIGETVDVYLSFDAPVNVKSMSIKPVYDASKVDVLSGTWQVSGFLSENWNPSNPDDDAVLAFISNTSVSENFFKLSVQIKETSPIPWAEISVEIAVKTKTEGAGEVFLDTQVESGLIGSYPVVTVSSGELRTGEQVTIKVSVSDNFPAKALSITPIYDSSLLTLVSNAWLVNGILAENYNGTEPAVIAFTSNQKLSGDIFEMVFEVNECTENTTADISINFTAEYTDGGNKNVPFTLNPGEIEITTYILGDLNDDGFVTSDDAIYLLRATLIPANYPLNQPADFNKDSYVTSDDAIYLLRHTLMPDKYPLS